jgi:hypothetical protein
MRARRAARFSAASGSLLLAFGFANVLAPPAIATGRTDSALRSIRPQNRLRALKHPFGFLE